MSQEEEITSVVGCFARVFWFALGPTFLFLCAVVIVFTPQISFPGVLDIIYGGLLIIIIIARFLDRPPKQKMEEYKAGLISARRYIIILSISSIVLWLVAHFVLKQIL
ncbi:MAG: hypothetical protein V1709_09245 [Planctomycetota bacterium]